MRAAAQQAENIFFAIYIKYLNVTLPRTDNEILRTVFFYHFTSELCVCLSSRSSRPVLAHTNSRTNFHWTIWYINDFGYLHRRTRNFVVFTSFNSNASRKQNLYEISIVVPVAKALSPWLRHDGNIHLMNELRISIWISMWMFSSFVQKTGCHIELAHYDATHTQSMGIVAWMAWFGVLKTLPE